MWLPGRTEPVVSGRIDRAGSRFTFTYGRSYLERDDAVSLYDPELPLRRGRLWPSPGLSVAGVFSDAGPDAWGRRVILGRHLGRLTPADDTDDLGLITYLLESGSDRIGALDFQRSPTTYTPRVSSATLAEMQTAAQRLESGEVITPDLDAALLHGTSIGGARPKVLIDDGPRRLIAKLSSATDHYPVVKAEGVAMNLARRVGLEVAGVEATTSLGRDVLLVERFDRPTGGGRRMMVSVLTLLGLNEMVGRHATYPDLADLIRQRFERPQATLHELFSRIVFNICVGNTDDHARNHAAFWDGGQLRLTPAYDLCPQPRSGGEAAQAMAIGRDQQRRSQLRICRDAAAIYQLTDKAASDIIDHQVTVITEQWNEAADEGRLTAAEKKFLWHRQILNPFIHHDQ